jgi:hypothetical protein
LGPKSIVVRQNTSARKSRLISVNQAERIVDVPAVGTVIAYAPAA